MRAQMGEPGMAELNTTVLDGKAVSASEALAAACAMPFLSDRRLVIVEGMLAWLARKGAGKSGKDQIAALLDGLPHLPPTARLVFAERDTLTEQNAVLKLARTDPNGYHKEFNPPRDPGQWIRNRARQEYGVEIDHPAAYALGAVTGPDLRAADNELAKLAAFVGGERPITEADVALLTSYVAEASVFEMVDALGRRDGTTATRLLHRLLRDDEPLQLFGMIVRQFRLLILAREYLNTGGSAGQIAPAIGVHPFVGEKLAKQAGSFTLETLEKIYHNLLDTDAGIKTGKVDPVLALDLFIAGISS
jgi:DNA polymerase-3 subunit delta